MFSSILCRKWAVLLVIPASPADSLHTSQVHSLITAQVAACSIQSNDERIWGCIKNFIKEKDYPVSRKRTHNTSTKEIKEDMEKHAERNAATSPETLSEYELLRQQKMRRNQEKLRSLGLLTSKDESVTLKPTKRTVTTQHPMDTRNEPQRQPPPSRRVSLRLRGIDPFPTGKRKSNTSHLPSSQKWSQKNTLVDMTNVTHDVADRSEQTSRLVIPHSTSTSTNKSTTKEHCQMRIRTMSIPQLQQRIRIIERAQGQHCVAKLSIMYQCCKEANLVELAEQAQDAIHRLTTRK